MQDIEKAIGFKKFYEQNKEFFVHERNNIIKALRERIRIKNKNMKEYRARMMTRVAQNEENMDI